MNKLTALIGNSVSLFGVCLSIENLNKLESVITISIAVLGFIISVIIPSVVKIVNKINKAKEDGVITDEEIDEICDDAKELVDKIDDKIKGDK